MTWLMLRVRLDTMSRSFSSGTVQTVRSAIRKIRNFDHLPHSGTDTPTGAKLGQIIDMYLPLIEHPDSTHEPISIIVITDGAASKGANSAFCSHI